VNVTGQTPVVELLHAEATDQLDFETFSGIDTVASGGLTAGAIQLSLDGVLIP
jgi:phage-related protein